MYHSALDSMFTRVVDGTVSALNIARMVVTYVAEQAYAQTVVSMHPSVQADSMYLCGTPVVHVHKKMARIRIVPPKQRLSIPQLVLNAHRLFDRRGGA